MRHRPALYVVLFLTSWLLFPGALPRADDALSDRLVLLDGRLSDAERGRASETAPEEELTAFLEIDDKFLWLRIRTAPAGVASLCLAGESTVTVLHASAALGMLRYEPADEDWLRNGSFKWELRDGSASAEALAARQRYLETNGWVATTASMGDPGEFEFLIQRDRFAEGATRLALGIMRMEAPNDVFGFPASAAGDCARSELVKGSAPEDGMQFEISEWIVVPAGE